MLYVIATPIGNLSDISLRALEVLRDVDVLAAEDTRRTRQLLSHFDIPTPEIVLSYREQTEHSASEKLIALLEAGKSVALCTDGGYPGISDPGYRLLAAAAEQDMDIQVLPGASAVPLALLQSGLPTSSYTFRGFPPRKSSAMKRFFEADADRPHTQVFFESPKRVLKSLSIAYDALGDRQAAVCRELTKKFEEVRRGYLSDLVEHYTDRNVKGEVTIVIAGNNEKFQRDTDQPEET